MPFEKVTVEWMHDQVFTLRDHQGYSIVMAQPEGVLGADLLPLSLIGCAGWDVMNILRKQRQEVRRFEVEAESERDDTAPWVFRAIHVRYKLWGSMLEQAAIERAIHLTEEKYCSIYVTLKLAIKLTSEYEIFPGEDPQG